VSRSWRDLILCGRQSSGGGCEVVRGCEETGGSGGAAQGLQQGGRVSLSSDQSGLVVELDGDSRQP